MAVTKLLDRNLGGKILYQVSLPHIIIENTEHIALFSFSPLTFILFRRHSSIGPQERRSSAINLSPPTVSHTISAVKCCFIVKHSELCRHSKSICLSSSPPKPPTHSLKSQNEELGAFSKFNELSSSCVVIILLIFASRQPHSSDWKYFSLFVTLCYVLEVWLLGWNEKFLMMRNVNREREYVSVEVH
jgi:hypothetical protein